MTYGIPDPIIALAFASAAALCLRLLLHVYRLRKMDRVVKSRRNLPADFPVVTQGYGPQKGAGSKRPVPTFSRNLDVDEDDD